MWGLLEHRIRSLPHVVSCSIAPQGLTVLVDLGGDPSTVRAAVEAAAAAAAYPGPVRVIGGKDAEISPFFGPRRAVAASAFAASLAGAATLLTSVFGTSVGTQPAGPPSEPDFIRRPVAAGPLAPGALAGGPPSVEGTGGADRPVPVGAVVPAREASDRAEVRPIRQDPAPPSGPSRDVPDTVDAPRRVSRGGSSDTKSARGGGPGSEDCKAPPDRDAPRDRRGRHNGNGPRSWSRSVLIEPHGCRE